MPYNNRKRKYSSMSRGAKAGRLQSKYNRTGIRKTAYKVARYGGLRKSVTNLYKMIETKESQFSLVNQQVAHNNVYIWTQNPLETNNGIGDPMAGMGSRIGDQVTLKGLAASFFVEGSLQRSKVHFRIMLLKGARGASFTRADIFKGMSGNKMIDQLNTEKYTVIAQRRFNVSPPNNAPLSLSVVTGVPATEGPGITGNKIVNFWIPGRKFGRDGIIRYENIAGSLKFFDYRWVILAYDWYGTPQDTNNVGYINEAWSKMYFKDA